MYYYSGKKIGRSNLLLFLYRKPYLKTKTIILLLDKRKYVNIEELTEFATAIIDYESCCSGSDADETVKEHNEKLMDKKYALLEEFADVMICLHLMKKAYGLTDEMISKAVRIKLDNYKKKNKENL